MNNRAINFFKDLFQWSFVVGTIVLIVVLFNCYSAANNLISHEDVVRMPISGRSTSQIRVEDALDCVL